MLRDLFHNLFLLNFQSFLQNTQQFLEYMSDILKGLLLLISRLISENTREKLTFSQIKHENNSRDIKK